MIELLTAIAIIGICSSVVIWPMCRIARRMGYSPWWAIAMLIPLVDNVLIWIVGFNPWPVEKGSRPSMAARIDNSLAPEQGIGAEEKQGM